MVHSFHATVAEARRHGDLYFAALLSQDRIEKAFGTARGLWQGWIYTPAITVWVFLSQCLSPDHSCRDAVARLIAWRLTQGLPSCSADTGAYCTARGDLPGHKGGHSTLTFGYEDDTRGRRLDSKPKRSAVACPPRLISVRRAPFNALP